VGQAAGAQLASGGQELKIAADLAQQARAACRGQAELRPATARV
jgi:hypothetical protein